MVFKKITNIKNYMKKIKIIFLNLISLYNTTQFAAVKVVKGLAIPAAVKSIPLVTPARPLPAHIRTRTPLKPSTSHNKPIETTLKSAIASRYQARNYSPLVLRLIDFHKNAVPNTHQPKSTNISAEDLTRNINVKQVAETFNPKPVDLKTNSKQLIEQLENKSPSAILLESSNSQNHLSNSVQINTNSASHFPIAQYRNQFHSSAKDIVAFIKAKKGELAQAQPSIKDSSLLSKESKHEEMKQEIKMSTEGSRLPERENPFARPDYKAWLEKEQQQSISTKNQKKSVFSRITENFNKKIIEPLKRARSAIANGAQGIKSRFTKNTDSKSQKLKTLEKNPADSKSQELTTLNENPADSTNFSESNFKETNF